MSTTLLALRAPSSNRVYAAAAGPLAVAEARWVLGTRFPDVHVRERVIAGIDHLEITVDSDPAEILPLISTLSGVLAVYEALEDPTMPGEELLLRPVRLPDVLHHGSDLETTLKYGGKTNEQFTALLINLAASLSEHRDRLLEGTLSLMDPLCGRGTTLHRALRLGLSPTGADLDRRDTDACRTFLTQWATHHRYPHTAQSGKLTVHGRTIGTRFDLRLARDRAGLRAGGQSLTVLGCDTLEIGGILRDASVDALVADLPYGVQHGAREGGSLQRSVVPLLRAAAPVWRSLLRPGAGMALALNLRTTPYEDAVSVLEESGFLILATQDAFRHRVDHSIDRGVLLAVRTDHPRAEQLRLLGTPEEKDL